MWRSPTHPPSSSGNLQRSPTHPRTADSALSQWQIGRLAERFVGNGIAVPPEVEMGGMEGRGRRATTPGGVVSQLPFGRLGTPYPAQQQQHQVHRTRVNGTRGVSRMRPAPMLSPPKPDPHGFVEDGHSFSGGGGGGGASHPRAAAAVDPYAGTAGYALPDLNAGARRTTSRAKVAANDRPHTRGTRGERRSPRRRREHGPPPPSISKSAPASSGLNNLVHATVGG